MSRNRRTSKAKAHAKKMRQQNYGARPKTAPKTAGSQDGMPLMLFRGNSGHFIPFPCLDTHGPLPATVGADDGTVSVNVEVPEMSLTTFAVFDAAGTGLVREYLFVVGLDALPASDDAELCEFLLRRHLLGDPNFPLPPVGPARSMLHGQESGHLHRWTYAPYEPALDGTRTVLVTSRFGTESLLVVGTDGCVCDGWDCDPTASAVGYREFLARRAAAGDIALHPVTVDDFFTRGDA